MSSGDKRKGVPIESPLNRSKRSSYFSSSHSFISPINTLDEKAPNKFPLNVERLPKCFQSSSSYDSLVKKYPASIKEDKAALGRILRTNNDSSSESDNDDCFSINANFKSNKKIISKDERTELKKISLPSCNSVKISHVQYQDAIFPSRQSLVSYSNLELLFVEADRLAALKGQVDGDSVLTSVSFSKVQRVQFICDSSEPSSEWFIDLVLVPGVLDLSAFKCESVSYEARENFSKNSTLRLNLSANCGMSIKSIENILISIVRDRKALRFTSIRDQYGEFEESPISKAQLNTGSSLTSSPSLKETSLSSPSLGKSLSTWNVRTYSSRVVPSLESLSASDSVRLKSSVSRKNSAEPVKSSPDATQRRTSQRINSNSSSKSKKAESFTYVDPEFEGESVKLFSFPEGEMDSVMVTSHELARLEPGIWLNDTLIDFDLKFIWSQLNTQVSEKVHIFNSFFYRRLSSSPVPSKIHCIDGTEPEAAVKDKISGFDRVKSWTRKINVFEKDYLVIPINESLHWFLVVICDPGAMLLHSNDDTVECNDAESECESESSSIILDDREETSVTDIRITRIMIFDSLGITSRGRSMAVIRRLRSYLQLEAQDKLSMNSDSKKCIGQVVKVPQQDNFNDCGCFLLQFAEEFLKTCSDGRFLRESLDLSDWFPSSTAQNRRELMKQRIQQLSEDFTMREKLRPINDDESIRDISGSSDIEEIIQ